MSNLKYQEKVCDQKELSEEQCQALWAAAPAEVREHFINFYNEMEPSDAVCQAYYNAAPESVKEQLLAYYDSI